MAYRFEEIEENSEFSYSYKISQEAHGSLVNVFGDRSPIHVDESYAKAAGFSGLVMHGAILQCFLSHFVGMHFPGRRSMLLSANIGYRQPCFMGDVIRLTARVKQKVESARVVVLDVNFVKESADISVATGRVQVMVRDE